MLLEFYQTRIPFTILSDFALDYDLYALKKNISWAHLVLDCFIAPQRSSLVRKRTWQQTGCQSLDRKSTSLLRWARRVLEVKQFGNVFSCQKDYLLVKDHLYKWSCGHGSKETNLETSQSRSLETSWRPKLTYVSLPLLAWESVFLRMHAHDVNHKSWWHREAVPPGSHMAHEASQAEGLCLQCEFVHFYFEGDLFKNYYHVKKCGMSSILVSKRFHSTLMRWSEARKKSSLPHG